MTVIIDNKPCSFECGEMLIDIAHRNGISIPTLCHHGGLSGQGCCRLCIVEIEEKGRRRIVTACIFPVEGECTVFTNSENVLRQRKMILSLLQALAPESDEIKVLCDEGGIKPVERFVKQSDKSCILCGLCVNACDSLGTGALSTAMRGTQKLATTPYDEPSEVCVGCASCAEVCPTSAIALEADESIRKIWGKTFPITHCKTCGISMGTFLELRRAAKLIDAKVPSICESCKKKSIADVMAATYGS